MISKLKHRAANHFGLGCCQRDLLAMGDDPKGWLVAQLRPRRAVGVDVPPSSVSLVEYQDAFIQRRALGRRAAGDSKLVQEVEAMQRELRVKGRDAIRNEVSKRVQFAVSTDAPFRERLVNFYSNHFTVSQQGRPQLIGSCTAYENEAVRTSLDGKFADMLVKAVGHPVMLLYLDNAQSVGPNSRVGRRRDMGLNENLAREILELHTLGVNGGYGQDDVKGLARILTGWTVGNPRRPRLGGTPGKAMFAQALHEPGSHVLLGKTYRNSGADQGLAALRDIALHPSTARHLATKLARHFIADDPPESAVVALERAYLESEGDLPTVHRRLLDLDVAWSCESRKFKMPHEYVVSVFRGLDLAVDGIARRAVLEGLRMMNHLPFTAPSPAGWKDSESHWAAPASVKQRLDWGIAIGQRLGGRFDARSAAGNMLEPTRADALMRSIDRAESAQQAMAILLASPNMQWRS